jgi:hypothetical protein
MRKTALSTVIASLFCATPALAWNNFGHMTVAAVAYEQLTPSARKKAVALLKLNPAYPDWVTNVPEQERDLVAFVTAATWPDAIKKRGSGYVDDGENPATAGATKNEGYADNLRHRYWHYIDVPFAPDGTPLKQPMVPNAKTQISLFRAALASSTTSDDLKSYDLVWLLHLVGDVHQPLHCTSRFDRDQPNGDRGGNLVALCARPCRSELHALRDDILGTRTDPESAIRKAAKLDAPDPRLAAVKNEQTWINESFQVAKTSVYVDPIGVGAGPFKVDAEYRKQARTIAAERVALAGTRLANLLNAALK